MKPFVVRHISNERLAVNKTRKVWMLFLAVILVSLAAIPKAWSDENNPPKERTLRVQGEGKITAVPDQSEMEFQVSEDGTEVEDVSSLVQSKIEKIFKTIKSFDVPDKDIQTIDYTVGPKTKYVKGESIRIGYSVSTRIKVVVRKMDLTGKILKAVIQDGVTTIDGPYFSFSNPSQLKIEALQAAVQDANAKAEAIAKTAEVDLGKVFSISQTSLSMPTNRQRIGYAGGLESQRGGHTSAHCHGRK